MDLPTLFSKGTAVLQDETRALQVHSNEGEREIESLNPVDKPNRQIAVVFYHVGKMLRTSFIRRVEKPE